MDFYDPDLDKYVVAHTDKEPPVLAELNRETWLKHMIPQMIAGHYQGRALSMFTQMISPKRILEVGTFTGYSAICMAEGLQEGGKISTIEVNEELEEIITRYFKKAAVSEVIDLHLGKATEIIPTMDGPFDMVYLDADKINYANYYDLVFDKLRPGGFIVADNTLWSGKVLLKEDEMDEDTLALVKFCAKVQEDDRVENCLFPLRDGILVSRKK